VSTNPETLDGLQSYLRAAGVACRSARPTATGEAVPPADANAAVIFPDDFEQSAMLALVRHLRRTRPRLLAIVVTGEPRKFLDLAKPEDGRALPLVVFAKPSFGWEILDALRALSESAVGSET
jgi:hypothetical protein